MALPIDSIRQIALNADYATTINLLKSYPILDSINFWKEKCIKLYPSKDYFNFFTGPENFLLKERTFLLTINDTDDLVIANKLIEYHPLLEQQAKIMQAMITSKWHHIIKYLEIFFDEQYSVIKRDDNDKLKTIYQDNDKNLCYAVIKEDAVKETYDCDYYIVDLNLFSFTGDYKQITPEWIPGSRYNKNL